MYGRAVAPVSPSRQPERTKVGPTIDISGRIGRGSSASVSLSRSLGSRLRARLPTAGSTLFSMTWSEKVTPAGRHVSRLVASAHRTSDNGSGSWPTPRTEHGCGPSDGVTRGWTPEGVARLAYWPTPKVATGDYQYSSGNHDKIVLNLSGVAKLASWATPTTRDHKDGDATSCQNVPVNALLGRQVTLSLAETANPGQLNPRFSLWLQGYPTAWASCGERVIRSSRKSRPRSSQPT
jgi:hypothetical protein